MTLRVLSCLLCSSTWLAAETYRLPPPEVVSIVDAPPSPSVSVSPDGKWMLLIERDALPPIADLSRRMLRLAGMRIDPAANGYYRASYSKGMALRDTQGKTATRIPLPPGARLAGVDWSHGSRFFVYTLVVDSGTELWGASVEKAAAPRRLVTSLNTLTGGVVWMPDGASVLCRLVGEDRGLEPAAPKAPRGPNVQETAGDASPLRTYQDLLSSAHDVALFEYYATSRLAVVALRTGEKRPIGHPGIYAAARPSPDGRHLLVTRVHGPYSYLMPWSRFPRTIAVWNLEGRTETIVTEVPLGENIPIGGVRTGPRSVAWKASAAATLVWAEALDGGDPKRTVPHRDRWMTAAAPFAAEARELLRVKERARSMSFLRDPSRVLTSEYDRDRRWTRTLLHDLGDPERKPLVLEDRSVRDRYGDPGTLVRETIENGASIVRQEGPWVYRTGAGASPRGMLPFLDRQNIETLRAERIWECERGSYETVVAITADLPDRMPTVITRHETTTSPPNYRRRELEDGTSTALTHFTDPTPQLRGIEKELVTYEREDCVQLSATLYLPPDREEGTRLPLLVWAYPREYNDPKTAGQIATSPWRFTRIAGASHLSLLTQGYAIMDGATIPIIGDPETMNDTFREQLVRGAKAAIRKAADMGVADPQRVGVGGHSYGAFMTANLLAHSDLFRAGVARSGAYNRTLTPFGFQAERRTVWEAPDVYFSISPFLHAHKINEPILLIHGEIDNNSGTYPVQSERFFQAIKGNGGTARLVMLPMESHGYRARESVLHVLAEMIDWLDRHVKGAAASGD